MSYTNKKSKNGYKIEIDEMGLIKEICKRPILYDRSLKAYRKLSLRNQYWQEVANILDADVSVCRRRWRSLRDSFSKRYKQPDRVNIKWPYYNQMSFITPYLDNTSVEIDELMPDYADNSEGADSDLKSNISKEICVIEDVPQCTPHKEAPDIEMHLTTSKCANDAPNSEQIDMTSNEQFLLSCASILNRLSKRKNALVRLKIQQLLYDIEFDETID